VNGADTIGDASPEARVDYKVAFLPDSLSQVAIYPNPFDSNKDQTHIVYMLKADGDTTLRIYDGFGALVRKMQFSAGQPGGHSGGNDVLWTARSIPARRSGREPTSLSWRVRVPR